VRRDSRAAKSVSLSDGRICARKTERGPQSSAEAKQHGGIGTQSTPRHGAPRSPEGQRSPSARQGSGCDIGSLPPSPDSPASRAGRLTTRGSAGHCSPYRFCCWRQSAAHDQEASCLPLGVRTARALAHCRLPSRPAFRCASAWGEPGEWRRDPFVLGDQPSQRAQPQPRFHRVREVLPDNRARSSVSRMLSPRSRGPIPNLPGGATARWTIAST
jgi:hypothetical protein